MNCALNSHLEKCFEKPAMELFSHKPCCNVMPNSAMTGVSEQDTVWCGQSLYLTFEMAVKRVEESQIFVPTYQ